MPEQIETLDLDSSWYHRLKKAWKETEGQVLMYGDKLALLPFHYLSNGMTRSGAEVLQSEEYPYLKVRECKTDLESEKQLEIKNKGGIYSPLGTQPLDPAGAVRRAAGKWRLLLWSCRQQR